MLPGLAPRGRALLVFARLTVSWSFRPAPEPRSGVHHISATLQKGGVPAAPSGTATLLRLSPSHHVRPRRVIPDFRRPRLPWLDGRCVQGPGTYSPRHSDSRLLAIPTSWSRVADSNPDYELLSGFRSTSRLRFPLYNPL